MNCDHFSLTKISWNCFPYTVLQEFQNTLLENKMYKQIT